MGAAIVNDDGAISIIPSGTPARKEYPDINSDDDDDRIIVVVVPIVVTLVEMVTDVSPVHPSKTIAPNDDDDYGYYTNDSYR